MPGPPPKRSDQRRRVNTPAAGEPVKVQGAREVVVPDSDPDWHPVAGGWFASLAQSGQSVFYEPSDWAAAYVLAETMSRELKPQPVISKDGDVTMVLLPPKSASITAWLKGMSALLATEGDRRKVAIELQRPAEEVSGDVSWFDDARRRLRESG